MSIRNRKQATLTGHVPAYSSFKKGDAPQKQKEPDEIYIFV
jgi:hypothetical protein